MMGPRWRPIFFSALALIAIWLIAITGHTIAKNSRMTADKVRAYVESVNLSKLSAQERAKALKRLADMLNALSLEERRRARMERIPGQWFDQMTEDEKSAFIEAT